MLILCVSMVTFTSPGHQREISDKHTAPAGVSKRGMHSLSLRADRRLIHAREKYDACITEARRNQGRADVQSLSRARMPSIRTCSTCGAVFEELG